MNLTPPEHEHSAMICEAARWLLGPRERTGRATVPELRDRFGLNPVEAIDAIREAHRIRRKGGARGCSS